MIDIIQYKCISSRFFEKQPNEICSHLRETASKGTFLEPEKLQNQGNEGKGKDPARYIYTNIIEATFDIATFGQMLPFFGNVSENLEYLVIRPSGCQYGT